MAQITLNREDSERVLANENSSAGARIVAAAAIAFFEVKESSEDSGRECLAIAQKLAHMTLSELYDAIDLHVSDEETDPADLGKPKEESNG